MQTIHQKLESSGCRPSGFDYLRITLAVSVVFWHSFGVSYGVGWTHTIFPTPWRVLIFFILPSFFSLSGFLVAGSLGRSPLPVFVGLRAIRIIPALAVETAVSAFIIGPTLTAFTLPNYFSDPLTWKYLHNITGHNIQYELPGLFLDNPISGKVNGQLWTVPWELVCYLTLTIIALFGVGKNKYLFLGFGFFVPLLLQAIYVYHFPDYQRFTVFGYETGQCLVLCFLAGVVMYKFRTLLPYSGLLVVSAILLFIIGLYSNYIDIIIPIPIAIITATIGATNVKKIAIIRFGDMSYGIYLYGYVIQQAVANFGPIGRNWYTNFPISIVIAAAVATGSWHYIEKPCLALKKPLFSYYERTQRFWLLVKISLLHSPSPPELVSGRK